MFGINTQEKIPDEFLTDCAVWDGYIGHVWYNLLFFANFTKDSSVIEVAPGGSVKLGIALSKFGYQGDLFVVDIDADSLRELEPKYRQLMPRAKIHMICGSLKEKLGDLPKNPAFLMGNHIIDDMILAEAATPDAQKNIFSWAASYTDSPSDAVRQRWQYLLADEKRLSSSKQVVGKDMIEAIKKIEPENFIFSQYPSSVLYDHGLSSLNTHAFSVFDDLKKFFRADLSDPAHIQTVLSANRNFGNAHIGGHILNAEYWLLCRLKKI